MSSGFVLQLISMLSVQLSLSSSLSWLSPIPSLSKSDHSFGFNGNSSFESKYPSLSSSLSQMSPILSLSKSSWSGLKFEIQLSFSSSTPSLSLSGIIASLTIKTVLIVADL